jgi:hypothetical protein
LDVSISRPEAARGIGTDADAVAVRRIGRT